MLNGLISFFKGPQPTSYTVTLLDNSNGLIFVQHYSVGVWEKMQDKYSQLFEIISIQPHY